MWTDRIRRALRREDGFAIIATMVIASVMMLFTMGMLATGIHLTDATVRDQRWNVALQVAEAGLDHAAYEIGKDDTYTGTGDDDDDDVVPVTGGEAQIVVDRPSNGQIVVYATGWVPSRSAPNALRRRIRAEFGPEDVFSFALFSTTGLFVKSGTGAIVGDVFANDGIEVDNTSTVDGSVISATEGVEIGNSATVTGDVRSGGPAGIVIANTGEVQGGVYAQSGSCAGSAPPGEYGVVNNGTVGGGGVAWGSITNVPGATPFNCQLAAATKLLPSFRWEPALYSGEVEYTDIASFVAFLQASGGMATGVHHVWVDECTDDPSGPDSVIDLDDVSGQHVQVVDDFTLVTNCRLDLSNHFTVTAPQDALVNIIVLNSSVDPAAVTIKNSFDVTNDAAVLLYSPGVMKVNNSAESNGAVYAGAISIKNSLDITYDPRVERTLGFGDLKYDRMAWVECVASTTGTDC